jgi:hypothetical protein
VTVVIASGLRWADIDATRTPTLYKLAGSGAVGNLNAKPRAIESWEPPSSFEGALEISAGNWVTPEFSAANAFSVGESVGASTAGAAYQRVTGISPGDAAIAFLGISPAARTASVTADDVVLGTLGQAVLAAGGSTVAVGNSDTGETTAALKYQRPAALAAMDGRGLVAYGDVSRSLLASDALAPYGLKTDLGAFASALAAAEASASRAAGPLLVVLDPGDAYRARRFAFQASDAVVAAQHAEALRTLDRVAALALARADRTDLVLVVGEGPPIDPSTGVQGFSPVLASGAGLSGYLSSSSTHRPGMAANPDIAATALQVLGIVRPVQVIGNPLFADPAPADAAARIAHLSGVNLTVSSIDSIRGSFTDALVRLFASLLALTALFVVLASRLSERGRAISAVALKSGSLIAIASITSGWLLFVFAPVLASPQDAAVALCITTLLLFAACALVWRMTRNRLAPACLLLASSALLVTDQLLGAPLSVANVLGYSPLQGARYYGIGNEAAAFMLSCGLVGFALLADEYAAAPWCGALRRYVFPVAGVVAIVAAAAPLFGANVGVAVWGIAGLAVAWTLMNGHRITWKTLVIAAVLVAVLIGGFAALDVFGGGAQTHLARSLSSAEQGGASQLLLIVQRKAETNVRVLFGVGWWFISLAASLAFLTFLRLRPGLTGRALFAENPAFSSAVTAALAAGIVAFFTEDTGILLITVILLPLCAAAVWLVLTAVADDTGGSR